MERTVPLKFTTKEKRDELAERLLNLARHMLASRDQGGHHQITVTDEMMEDIQTAACVVRLSDTVEVTPVPAFPKCEYCEKWHDPRVACPEYMAFRAKCPHGMSSAVRCSTCQGY